LLPPKPLVRATLAQSVSKPWTAEAPLSAASGERVAMSGKTWPMIYRLI
jgi:hypothetical protein